MTGGMSTLIGIRSDTRLACDPDTHLLATWNSWQSRTWCVCGQVKIPGQHVTHHERFIYDHAGKGAVVTGYDQYTLGDCDCHPSGVIQS